MSVEASRSLPWWRRPRELQRQLAGTLVATALASVLLIGGLNFFAARQLLDDGTQDQLVGLSTARARSIEVSVDRLVDQVSALAGDLGVVAAFDDLATGFDSLDGTELTDEQAEELDRFYRTEVVEPLVDAGFGDVVSAGIEPTTDAARYVQYHYVIEPRAAGLDPAEVDDAGDGSGYSAAHAAHHESLATVLTSPLGSGDAMLVTPDGDIVYTVDKRIDLGTNLFEGASADGQLARVVNERLTRVRSGEAVLADLQLYMPAAGHPVFFVAVSVKNDTETIGTLAVEVPAEALSAITTSDGQWEQVGLQSGESYVVGSDLILRSESRKWIEDPEGYLADLPDDERTRQIALLGSPIGLQVVDTEPVEVAFDGEEFAGTTKSYLGTNTFSYSEEIDVAGVDWAVVVDVPQRDARDPLYRYARRLGLVLLIVLPIAALVGLWLARRLTRPIGPVLEAANAIADGERQIEIDDLGNDEFGDLARRLGTMAEDLGAREAALAAEFDQRRDLLLAVLPPRLVDSSGQVVPATDLTDIATVVAVVADVRIAEVGHDEDRIADLLDQVASLADASRSGTSMERVRASAETYLYLAGVGDDDDGADTALEFIEEHTRRFAELQAREDIDIRLRVGVATGPVATGILDGGSLTFGAWGLPVRQASALAAMSQSDEVLVDASTQRHARGVHVLSPATDSVALDGEAMELYTLGSK